VKQSRSTGVGQGSAGILAKRQKLAFTLKGELQAKSFAAIGEDHQYEARASAHSYLVKSFAGLEGFKACVG